MRRPLVLIALLGSALAVIMATGVAQARPAPTDAKASLIAAGVPAQVVTRAFARTPAATGPVVHLTNPGVGQPAGTVDAVIDHKTKTVQVIQRFNWRPSQLSVGWVNLSTGASGISGLPNRLPRPDLSPNYFDSATTLHTGPGPVALVVWGTIPGWTGLMSLAPEYFGVLTPGGGILSV
ncbi:hypothetical protein GII30_09505 [Gordonia amarae]|uniref:MPT63-like domain-containing protein n=2 Tax=Gordonia amarae TaxID=36821 RepID=G7GPE8_9ACTN|nr:hypothetical protein [Gordonia amarae]MCS3878616.1 hypothetical protein [Gordonia amarae]QHN17212.1 hypothetical protein GII35_09730 [Gordonia amarae]QHN21738.1 hypothetical protein GII34_09510 [Gordonia amarae]QHN30589.1 hypothetical protein GII32_09520 [Gordonia amarae]QHN39366.1 hypothetical protein GII30_09505 [Gordonia amarae]